MLNVLAGRLRATGLLWLKVAGINAEILKGC